MKKNKALVYLPPLSSPYGSMAYYTKFLCALLNKMDFHISIVCTGNPFWIDIDEILWLRSPKSSLISRVFLPFFVSFYTSAKGYDLIIFPSQEFVFPTRSRSIIIVHDLIQINCPRNKFIKSLYRINLYLARKLNYKFVSVSHTTARSLEKMGISSYVIYNSFPSKILNFNFKHQPQSASIKRSFLWIGTGDPHKNISFLFKIIALRKTDNFVIVVPKSVNIPYKTANVTVFNEIDEQQLIDLYKYCTTLLVTSLDEGFCRPAFEAAVAGLEVFVPDIPLFNELNYYTVYRSIDELLALFEKPPVNFALSSEVKKMFTEDSIELKYKKIIYKTLQFQ